VVSSTLRPKTAGLKNKYAHHFATIEQSRSPR
jgi:hypothetical protein